MDEYHLAHVRYLAKCHLSLASLAEVVYLEIIFG